VERQDPHLSVEEPLDLTPYVLGKVSYVIAYCYPIYKSVYFWLLP